MASVDDVDTNTEFARKNKANFPILSDPSKNTARAYGVLAKQGYSSRWTYYIDPEGVIAHIDRQVTALTAGADIARTLRELGAPMTVPGN